MRSSRDRRGSLDPLRSVERRSKRIQRPQYFVHAQRLRGGTRGRAVIGAALFAARCRCRCRSRGKKRWRERPRCARRRWPRARPEGSLTPMAVSVAVSVRDGKQGGEKRLVLARRLRAIASTFSRTNWFCISWKCGSTNEAFSRAFRNSNVYRKSSWKSCLM
jgi:hypothetical protein